MEKRPDVEGMLKHSLASLCSYVLALERERERWVKGIKDHCCQGCATSLLGHLEYNEGNEGESGGAGAGPVAWGKEHDSALDRDLARARARELARERAGDGVNYACPSCGYDGSLYNEGVEGWVHVRAGDPRCAHCCIPVEDAFVCDRCNRRLSGSYHSAENCNETGMDLCLCGDCGRKLLMRNGRV